MIWQWQEWFQNNSNAVVRFRERLIRLGAEYDYGDAPEVQQSEVEQRNIGAAPTLRISSAGEVDVELTQVGHTDAVSQHNTGSSPTIISNVEVCC
jgi:hypothetical protein